jgi:hypothetical protein
VLISHKKSSTVIIPWRNGSKLESADGGGLQSYGLKVRRSQVKWKIMCVPLVHRFEAKVSTVENVGPGVDYTAIRRQQGLVKVETVAPVAQIYYFWEVDYIFIPMGCWALNPVIKEAKLLR